MLQYPFSNILKIKISQSETQFRKALKTLFLDEISWEYIVLLVNLSTNFQFRLGSNASKGMI